MLKALCTATQRYLGKVFYEKIQWMNTIGNAVYGFYQLSSLKVCDY